jgi:hypothetical protein
MHGYNLMTHRLWATFFRAPKDTNDTNYHELNPNEFVLIRAIRVLFGGASVLASRHLE